MPEDVEAPAAAIFARSGGVSKTFQLDNGRQVEFTRRDCDDMYEMWCDEQPKSKAELPPRPSDLDLLLRFMKKRHPSATTPGANLLSIVEITEFGAGLAPDVVSRCQKAAMEFAELSFVNPEILFVMIRFSELPNLMLQLDVTPLQLPLFSCFGETRTRVMQLANPNLSRNPNALRTLLERSLELTRRQTLFLDGVVSAVEARALRRETALREDAGPISASILADLATFPFAPTSGRLMHARFGLPTTTTSTTTGNEEDAPQQAERARYLARSRFPRRQVVNVVADSLNQQMISDRAAVVLAGVAKMFVVELTREACAARDQWHGHESELGSEHIREAYRRLHEADKIPYLPSKRRRFR